jgi:uncharacterized membrane protein YvlD (DUF360 family)
MKEYQMFIAFWLTNLALILLSNLLLPDKFVLGNSIFSYYQALVFSSFIWDVGNTLTGPILKHMEIPLKGTANKILAYFVANFFILWIIARFSFITGVGIASFVYIALMALVSVFVQYAIWKYVNKK